MVNHGGAIMVSFCFRSSDESSGRDSPCRGSIEEEFKNLTLEDIEVIATLGIGGFGRVELVSI